MLPSSAGRNPAGPATQLCVVDLASSTGAMPVVRALAERAARRALRRAGSADACRLLVSGGEADRPIADGLLPITRPADLLGPEALTEIHDWVEAVSKEVIDGRGRALFPIVGDVHLADLARLELQSYLFSFALVARSMTAVLESDRPAETVVITAERDRADALAALVAAAGCQGRTRWVPLVRPLRRTLSRLTMARRRPSPDVGLPPALMTAGALGIGVLTVSETNPMAETFAAIERHLDPACCGPVVRAQFGKATASDGPTRVVPLGRPGTIPARRGGRYSSQWAAALRQARTLEARAALGQHELEAPLTTILQHFFTERFDVLTEQVEYASALLDATRPGLLVVGNDRWYVSQSFVQVARARGISSVCVQDGVATDSAFWRWISADAFIASSHEVAARFERSGAAPDRLSVSGQPRYDELYAMRGADGIAARATLGVGEGDPLILFASQPHQTAGYTEEVMQALLRVPATRVLLRPHPAEPAARYDAYVQACPERVFMARGHTLSTMLLAADMVLIESSTVGLEAALLGRPVVTANFAGTPTLVPYAERGLARRARNGAELTSAITDVLAGKVGPVSLAALEQFVGPFDGGSAKRAATTITTLAGRRTAPSSGTLAVAGR